MLLDAILNDPPARALDTGACLLLAATGDRSGMSLTILNRCPKNLPEVQSLHLPTSNQRFQTFVLPEPLFTYSLVVFTP